MQPNATRDLAVGLFVLAGLAALAYLSLQVGGIDYQGPGGLELSAEFTEVGGLVPRAPVVISGVKVGKVKRIELTPELRARVVMDVDARYPLPKDTSAAIRTSGLLGDQYIALEPGADEELLQNGGVVQYTESALSIERLVGDLVHGSDIGGSKQ